VNSGHGIVKQLMPRNMLTRLVEILHDLADEIGAVIESGLRHLLH